MNHDSLVSQVGRVLRRLNLAGSRLVVAVSGGPDSLALLHTLSLLATELSLTLHIAHLNHALRGEASDRDAAFVATLAEHYHLSATIEMRKIAEERQSESIEEVARRVRYTFLAEVAAATGAAAVLSAHSENDQAETVLLNMIRGTGLAGLAGMPLDGVLPYSAGRVRLVRPLLGINRTEVEAFCEVHQLEPRIDLTNRDTAYRRNWVRHRLLPVLQEQNPEIIRSLSRLATNAAGDLAIVEQRLDEFWPDLVAWQGASSVALRLHDWRSLASGLQRQATRRAMQSILPPGKMPAADLVDAIVATFSGVHAGAKEITLPGNTLVSNEGHLLIFARQRPDMPALPAMPLPLSAPGVTDLGPCGTILAEYKHGRVSDTSSLHAELDADRLAGCRLYIRRRLPGDRMQPLGMGKEKKLQDLFVDARIPRHVRDCHPVLVAHLNDGRERIVWTAGLRIAEWAKIRPETSVILALEWQPPESLTSIATQARGKEEREKV